MIVGPDYQARLVVTPLGVVAGKKSSADQKQGNNDHAFPKTVHNGPDQSHFVLSFLHTQTSAAAQRANKKRPAEIAGRPLSKSWSQRGLKHSTPPYSSQRFDPGDVRVSRVS